MPRPIAGLMLEIKGDFPAPGEVLERGRVRLQAVKMESHRIMKIKAVVSSASPEGDDGR